MPAGHGQPALADDGRVAVGQPRDEAVESRRARGVAHFLLGRVRPRVADVLRDGRVEDERRLIDEHDVAPQILERDVAQIVAVERHRALVRIEQPEQQVGDRRLAAAARADERELLAGRDREGHRSQDLAAPEIDGDAIEHDRPFDAPQNRR